MSSSECVSNLRENSKREKGFLFVFENNQNQKKYEINSISGGKFGLRNKKEVKKRKLIQSWTKFKMYLWAKFSYDFYLCDNETIHSLILLLFIVSQLQMNSPFVFKFTDTQITTNRMFGIVTLWFRDLAKFIF